MPVSLREPHAAMQHKPQPDAPPPTRQQHTLAALQKLAGNRAIQQLLRMGQPLGEQATISHSEGVAQVLAVLADARMAADLGKFIVNDAVFGAPDFAGDDEPGFASLLLSGNVPKALDTARHALLLERVGRYFWANKDTLADLYGRRDDLPAFFLARLGSGMKDDAAQNEWLALVNSSRFPELAKPVQDGVRAQFDWVRRHFQPKTAGEMQQAARVELRRPRNRVSRSTSKRGQVNWRGLGLRADVLMLKGEHMAEAANLALNQYSHFRRDQLSNARGFKWEEEKAPAAPPQETEP